MCDYSIIAKASRPAKVGERLVSHRFQSSTGFAPVDEVYGDHCDTAVCVLPGTELAFDENIRTRDTDARPFNTAIFRQISKEIERTHHDVLEYPDGTRIALTNLVQGQRATVLQLPAAPKNKTEAQEQKRAEYAG